MIFNFYENLTKWLNEPHISTKAKVFITKLLKGMIFGSIFFFSLKIAHDYFIVLKIFTQNEIKFIGFVGTIIIILRNFIYDIKKFISNIKNWLNRPKWLNRLIFYFILFTIVFFFLNFMFVHFDFQINDEESARYMLSAQVQSEAAIIAIVITLSLIAVQLAAASYSARVIEVFKKTPDLWILLFTYIFAIMYGLLVLIQIDEESLPNLEGYISFSYFLFLFSLISLVPYIRKTLDLLKPSVFINLLSEKITAKNILSSLGNPVTRVIKHSVDQYEFILWEEEYKNTDSDPIQPIIDIIQSSSMRYDYATIRDGLGAIRNRFGQILRNDNFQKWDDERISSHFFIHFRRFGKQVANKKDDDSALRVLTELNICGKISVEQKNEIVPGLAIVAIGDIGVEVIKQKLEESALKVPELIYEIGMKTAHKSYEDSTRKASETLGKIGMLGINQELFYVSKNVVTYLEFIAKHSIKKNLEDAFHEAVISLKKISKIAIQQELNDLLGSIAHSLGEIGKTAAERECGPFCIMFILDDIGKYGVKEDLDYITGTAIRNLGVIGVEMVKKQKFQYSVRDCAKYIEIIGKTSAQKQFTNATHEAVKSLGEIGVTPTLFYLFNLDNISENNNEGLINYLKDECDFSWKKIYDIQKSDDSKTIQFYLDEYLIQIILDENDKKATLKLPNGLNHGLIVKKENSKLNFYAKHKLQYSTYYVLESLGEVGMAVAEEQELEMDLNLTINYLGSVGEIAAKQNLEESVKIAAKYLELLATKQKKSNQLQRAKEELRILKKTTINPELKKQIEMSLVNLNKSDF